MTKTKILVDHHDLQKAFHLLVSFFPRSSLEIFLTAITIGQVCQVNFIFVHSSRRVNKIICLQDIYCS